MDDDFRKKTGANISKRLLESGIHKGKKNPNFKYMIKDEDGYEYLIKDLQKPLGLSYSGVYNLITNYLKTGIMPSALAKLKLIIEYKGQSKVDRLSKIAQ